MVTKNFLKDPHWKRELRGSGVFLGGGHTFREMTTRVSGDILFCFMVKNIFLFFNKIILQKLWLSFP